MRSQGLKPRRGAARREAGLDELISSVDRRRGAKCTASTERVHALPPGAQIGYSLAWPRCLARPLFRRLRQACEHRKTSPRPGRGRQRRHPLAMKLYVGGLSFDTTDDGLRAFFEQAGTVESASVVTDRYSRRSRRLGLVAV